MAADGAAIQPVIGEATALEITKRQADGEDLYFIINFKTAYPEHNLVRARTQIALVADM